MQPYAAVRSLVLAVAMSAGVPEAAAQADLSGFWTRVDYEEAAAQRGPAAGDYGEFPLNAEALSRAAAYDPAIEETQPIRQCWPRSIGRVMFAQGPMEILHEADHVLLRVMENEAVRRVWTDGRDPPPAYALHTWYGFSAGEWEGGSLVVTTTHVKEGLMLGNGAPHSDQMTVTEYFTRHGEDLLTLVAVFDDPIYFTEPLVRDVTFRRMEGGVMPEDPCEAREPASPAGLERIPHFMPGESPLPERAGR